MVELVDTLVSGTSARKGMEVRVFFRAIAILYIVCTQIKSFHADVRRHVQPFPNFLNLTVGTLNKAVLKKWYLLHLRHL